MKRKTHSKYDDDEDKKKSDTKKYEQDRRKRLKGDEKNNERRHGRRSNDRRDDSRRSPSYTNKSRSRERPRNRSRERGRNRSRGRSRDISLNGKRSGRYNEHNDNFNQSHSGNYSKRNTKKRSRSRASSQSDSHSRRHSKYSNKYDDDKKLINPSKHDNKNYSRNRNYNQSVSNSVSRKGTANYSHNEYQMEGDQNYYEYSNNFRQDSYYNKNGNDPNRLSPHDDTIEDDKYNEGNNNKKKKNKHGKNNNNMNIANPNHIPIYNNGNSIDGTGYDKIGSANNNINNNATSYMHYNNMSHPMYMNNTVPNDANFESNMSVDGNIYNDHMTNPMSNANKIIPPMNNPNLINQHQPNMMVPPPPSSDGTFYNNMNMPHPNSRKPLVLIPNDNQMKMGSNPPGFVGPPDSIPNHPNMLNNMNMSGGMNMPNGFNPMGGDIDMKDLKFENQGLNMNNKNLMNNIPPPPDSDVKKNIIMPPSAPPYNENNLAGPGNINRFANNNIRNIVPPPYGNIVDNNMMNQNNKNISNPNYIPLNMQPNMPPNSMNMQNNYLNNTDSMGNPTSNINPNEMNPNSGLNMYDDKKYDNPNFIMMQHGEVDGMRMINNMNPSNGMLMNNSANYEEGERDEYDEEDSEQNYQNNLSYQNKPQLTREEKLNEWLETQLNKQTNIVHDAIHLILLISSISKKNSTKINRQKKTHTNLMSHLTKFCDNTVLNHLIENLNCSEKSDNFLFKEKLSYKLLQMKNINKERKNADNAEVNQNLDFDAQEDDNMLEKLREYILSNHRKNNDINNNENDIDDTTNKLNLPTNLDDPFDELDEDTQENLFEPVQSKETESKEASANKNDEHNQDDEENKNSFFLNIMKSKLGGTYSIFSKFSNKENIQDEDKTIIEKNEEDPSNEPLQNNNKNLIDLIKINDYETFDYKQYLASILINKICKKNNFNYKNILLDELSNISSDSLFFLNNYNITSDDFVNLY
ncbi:conserved Plasmodium protein, unknown function [Plasmodium vinckei vinckei]|uniref:Uncharacterized protein n=1 Tax=Plasmodium vinckei vinckei TaxID=54757 RepID=A0A081ID47_PLAVN|nr:conserved Plasmodium protein, unknown function [Plasmodium vinckei vinckei]KEG01605.1 hypothetical protein YYE_03703 [Plasmodium vinckei vinckei]VEV55588.1 conserved Plasmodium protein, unknown function [Plasmodium vinckei vinckei]